MSKQSIKVLGKQYLLDYRPDADMREVAWADYEKQKIVINKDMGKEHIKEKAIHEVLHIIDNELKLNLTEEQINGVSVGLYSTGKVNFI